MGKFYLTPEYDNLDLDYANIRANYPEFYELFDYTKRVDERSIRDLPLIKNSKPRQEIYDLNVVPEEKRVRTSVIKRIEDEVNTKLAKAWRHRPKTQAIMVEPNIYSDSIKWRSYMLDLLTTLHVELMGGELHDEDWYLNNQIDDGIYRLAQQAGSKSEYVGVPMPKEKEGKTGLEDAKPIMAANFQIFFQNFLMSGPKVSKISSLGYPLADSMRGKELLAHKGAKLEMLINYAPLYLSLLLDYYNDPCDEKYHKLLDVEFSNVAMSHARNQHDSVKVKKNWSSLNELMYNPGILEGKKRPVYSADGRTFEADRKLYDKDGKEIPNWYTARFRHVFAMPMLPNLLLAMFLQPYRKAMETLFKDIFKILSVEHLETNLKRKKHRYGFDGNQFDSTQVADQIIELIDNSSLPFHVKMLWHYCMNPNILVDSHKYSEKGQNYRLIHNYHSVFMFGNNSGNSGVNIINKGTMLPVNYDLIVKYESEQGGPKTIDLEAQYG